MSNTNTKIGGDLELPFELNISFEKIFNLFKQYASDDYKSHPFHASSKVMVSEIEKYPELINGFSNLDVLKQHEGVISLLLDPLFPELLQFNEIKAAMVPFSFQSFKHTERFQSILNNAGDGFELKVSLPNDDMYRHACVMILNMYYGYRIDLKNPFFFDIPDKTLDITNHYRLAFNADFCEVETTKKAPKITDDCVKQLLDNYDNIEIWKEKFPPNSYIFKGFGIMNLFDVSSDQVLKSLQHGLLNSETNTLEHVKVNLSKFFNIKDLKVGFSLYDTSDNDLSDIHVIASESLILGKEKQINSENYFCEGIIDKAFRKKEIIAISDVEAYGKASSKNKFYKRLHSNKVGSIILIPIFIEAYNELALLEIASPRAYELNTVNKQKLSTVIPVFEAAIKRGAESRQNLYEAIIQEHYTSIHPSVKWRFYDAAEGYQNQVYEGAENPQVDDIVFNNVYPLFGQSDIKGSSTARNEAIQADLIKQLTMAIDVFKQAKKKHDLPIYEELSFRIEDYLQHTKTGLKAGDEVNILSFLKRDIYPVFKHLKQSDKTLAKKVNAYLDTLDEDLQVVYEERKSYENSVTYLNNKLASYIDKKQVEAQEMFPHYFERYKTDGVEYNMYIGQSLVKNKTFDNLYLYNLRLWQLQNMYEMEQVAYQARQKMGHDLRVASLILVHSNPLSIKFRMDEKQFDVDGAYNVRYEIIKKRIDKSHIKGTDERITVPGKIAIIYSQEKDAIEYEKYIKYLQAKGYFGKLEFLDVEDLQGVSGLKALRVEVNYQNDFNEKSSITIDELMEEFK